MINNVPYKSQKALKTKVRIMINNLINKYNSKNLIDISPDCEDFKFWRDLLKRHPTKGHFNPTSFTLETPHHMYFSTGNETYSFSYNTCISGKVKSKKSDYFDCLRSSIEDQIKDFRKLSHPLKCSVCNISDDTKYEIDHVLPFKDIYENFKQTVEDIDQEDIKMYSDKKKHRTMFDLNDEYTKSLNDFWVEYHRKNCLLQVLCKNCHILKTNTK
jgi:hypothetical protein